MAGPNGGNGDLGFAAELFMGADKLRKNTESADGNRVRARAGVDEVRLFMPQRHNGVEARGLPSGVEAKEHTHRTREAYCEQQRR
jgi:hypothetical protein